MLTPLCRTLWSVAPRPIAGRSKWYLPDEELTDKARTIRRGSDDGRFRIVAPTHLRFEVGNSLRNAVRARRLAEDEAAASLAELFTSRIVFVDDDELLADALHLSLRLNTSYYDTLYLVLAAAVNGILISADNRFRRALGGSHPRVIWLEDYQPEA